jgi:hypothetical protein
MSTSFRGAKTALSQPANVRNAVRTTRYSDPAHRFDYDAPNVPDWVKPKAPARKTGGMSAAGRKAISDATKARWAKLRAEKAKAATPGISKKSAILAVIAPPEDAEFKKKMSEAMKASWAKRKKAAKKKAA